MIFGKSTESLGLITLSTGEQIQWREKKASLILVDAQEHAGNHPSGPARP
jgi:hypothetical protein